MVISAASPTPKAASRGKRPTSPTRSSARSKLSERPERQRRLVYGRRKGPALSAHQERLRETLLPTLALHLEAGRDPRRYFANVDDVWLEVGYGGGEHLLWQAQQHPHIGLIGAEPYISGTAKLLSKLDQTPISNIRLYEDDARDIIEALPDASIGRAFILFPDPWPKTRHHKRRFVQMDTLDAFARILKPGAELRFASDDAGYLAYALERLMAHPAFCWTANGPSDWKTRTSDWPPTRYEAKELHGAPVFLRFVRT
ncbi:MAG: tRNA (guanosine(46)-N7)-methyltransferase TrmB [Alphaproteobacteria bacterium]|nr:tRNA (guanosine(46)-N7)-methyltransferase TrmB [Alphaproteobacteria bacterium]MBV9419050.1 tRNA (guanosine(46)-N7)-methyltransferase TrmB [Alphaproteobacteria bacterium]MBV9904400.1 tRNA (guanosine(46)-N7)-methyltransferase TrmB [Alphaproteobacteria bacterium]